ncbi:ABC transporter substrate-binding protein [Stappia sp. ES.058]|uniref:ABC transporter substrate-binding protein n=1 Tax=Stappia sp. ES.058 TaxID=1881061 RepID=UPI00087A6E51|nr:ABC transporter substrate-binding protein [Stappia sp. ES.058]SDU03098.1 peptide/nickel transport system substrate-binding protein [Stappia sp. ES.058]
MTYADAAPVTIALPRLPLGDPHDCTDANDELTLYQTFYDTLVKRRDGTYHAHLAEGWRVSDDARTWTFDIRSGVAFHDGTACDAAAVAQSLHRMAREDKGYTLGSPAVWRQYLGGAEIEADGLTLTVRLTAPMADLLDVLVQGFIVAPSVFDRLDAGDKTAICGTGPYRLQSAGKDRVTATRNPDHFATAPKNETLVFVLETDAKERARMLADGRVQVANSLDPHIGTVAGAMLVRFTAPVAIIYLLNSAKGPLQDARVRRALSLAVDRQALIDTVLDGAADPLHGFVSPRHFGAGGDPVPGPNVAAARALLAEAGHADGLTLTLDCPTRLPDEAQKLTADLGAQLAAIDVRFDVRIHKDREAYAHMVRRKEIGDLCVFDSSPMSTFRVLYEKIDSRTAGAWWQGYRNEAIEALIDEGRVTSDTQARAALYRKAYAELQSDPAWLTLYIPHRAIGLSGNHPGFRMREDGVIDVADLPAFTTDTETAHG